MKQYKVILISSNAEYDTGLADNLEPLLNDGWAIDRCDSPFCSTASGYMVGKLVYILSKDKTVAP